MMVTVMLQTKQYTTCITKDFFLKARKSYEPWTLHFFLGAADVNALSFKIKIFEQFSVHVLNVMHFFQEGFYENYRNV